MIQKKIIIFGYNDVANELIGELPVSDIIVIDGDEASISKAKKDGVEAYVIDYNNKYLLRDLGIHRDAHAFFCVSNNSHLNLFMTLNARSLSQHIKIITLITSTHDHDKMILAGANKTINHYELSGIRAFRMLHKPNVLDLLDTFFFTKEGVGIIEVTIKTKSKLDGMMLFDVDTKSYDIIIVGIHDLEISDEFFFNAHTHNHKIDADDILVLLGKNDEIKRFLEAYN